MGAIGVGSAFLIGEVMKLQDEILKSIEIMIQKAIEKYQRLDVATVVTEVKNNKYKVTIDGAEYWLKDGVGITGLNVCTPVWVHLPNGKIGDAYIAAKR